MLFNVSICKPCTQFVTALVMDVQIYRGKEMEAVLDMLPYLRLANLSDPAEMESVIFAQGPVCPVSETSVDLRSGCG